MISGPFLSLHPFLYVVCEKLIKQLNELNVDVIASSTLEMDGYKPLMSCDSQLVTAKNVTNRKSLKKYGCIFSPLTFFSVGPSDNFEPLQMYLMWHINPYFTSPLRDIKEKESLLSAAIIFREERLGEESRREKHLKDESKSKRTK